MSDASPSRADLPGALAEALAAEAGAIVALLRAEPRSPGGEAAADLEEGRRLVAAVAAALDDDILPLAAALGLGAGDAEPAEVVERLDAGLRRLGAVCAAAQDRPAVRLAASAGDVAAAFATVSRLLAIQAAATLAARAAAAEERAASGAAAMAVTMHELRRPLTVLSSYSQLLAAGMLGELSEPGRDAAASMTAATETMSRLVEALGAVTRLEDPDDAVTPRDVDLGRVVIAAVDVVAVEADLRGIEIAVDAPPGITVRGDRERLTLAVTNLLSNAVKHSPDRGRIEVSCRRSGEAAHVVVRDHGPGFPAEAAARLFEKYYRDPGERERSIPGTGLGLYIVATVMERHRGRATARLAAGGGAEFELTLPAR